jgi:Ca2+-binding RTX toxin-like protein
MATYSIVTPVLNGATLLDVFTRSGVGSGLSTFTITNGDGTTTTFTGSNLTWSGPVATAGTVTSIVRKNAAGTIIYDQITDFTAGVNDSFVSIWNAANQLTRGGYLFSGDDAMTGSGGNDFFRGYAGIDTITGGTGFDLVAYDFDGVPPNTGTGVVIVNLSASTQMGIAANRAQDGFGSIDVLSGIEEARGGGNSDFFFGSTGYNFFQGRGGADTYDGGNSVAYFRNVAALQPNWNWLDYRQDGGAGSITLTLTDGTATPGIDGVGNTAGSGTDTFGNAETLTNINAIRGSMATATGDVVNGNSFFNFFEGLSGPDTFDGNAGFDRYSFANELRFGGSTTRGVIVNLSNANVTVGATTVVAHTAIDTFNGATGFVDTLIDVEEIQATNQADTVYGSEFDNTFFLFGGNDVAHLGGGFDYVEPGAGNDIVHGEAVGEIDQSYADRDEVSYDDFGAGGAGVYIDLNANTFVDPTGGLDTVFDIERLRGTSAADTLIGADFANQREELYRGLGGNDVIDGRGGFNIADYTRDAEYSGGGSGIIANLSASAVTVGAVTVQAGTVRDGFGATDTIAYIQGIRGTNFADTYIGNDARNVFRPMGGNDSIDGGDGLDAIEMYIADVFTGDGAVVNLSSSSVVVGVNTVLANTALGIGGGVSTLVSIEDVGGSSAADVIYGSAAGNAIGGWFGNDTIYGGDGDDKINGFQGSNTLDGGDGFDLLSFMYDSSIDDYHVLMFPGNGFVAWGGVTVDLGTNSAIGFDGLANTVTNFESVTGTFVADSITGNGLDNRLRGLSGNDTLNGAGGNDTIMYSPTNGDGRVLVQIVGVNYSEPNVVRVNLTAGSLDLGGITVLAGTALDGEGGTDTLISIENVVGSIGNDYVAASTASNVIDGGAGDDIVVYDGVEADYTYLAVNGGWQVTRIADPTDVDILYSVETLEFTGGAAALSFAPLGGTKTLAVQGLTASGDTLENEILGVRGDDMLSGLGGNDLIVADEGNDQLFGGDDDDELVGGDGNDTVNGDAGDDILVGGTGLGDDVYIGGSGIDTVAFTSTSLGVIVDLNVPGNPGGGAGTAEGADAANAEIGVDQLTGIENVVGGSGSDSITGDAVANNLLGEAGADSLLGEAGDDILQGGSGNDMLQGGADADRLYGDSDDDTLKGGAGDDIIDGGADSLAGGDTADLSDATGALFLVLDASGNATVTAAGIGTDSLIAIENIIAGSAGDTVFGNALANVVDGGGGIDVLVLAGGDDTGQGGAGNDYLYGQAGSDTLDGGADGDVVIGDSEADTLNGGAGDDYLFGGDGGDTIYALNAGGGPDAGVGIMYGEGGADTLNGSDGTDYFYGGAGADIFNGNGGVNAYITIGENIGETIGDTINGGSGQDYVYASDANDTMYGGANVDVFQAFGGDDVLEGGADVDYLYGGTGNDQFRVGLGNGTDVLLDFVAGGTEDTIHLVATGLTTFAQVQAAMFYSAALNTTIVTLPDSSNIWIVGAAPAQLTSDDFTFA